jgi:hypothetical protein
VRVRREPAQAGSADLVASLKGLLKPLWPGGSAKDR